MFSAENEQNAFWLQIPLHGHRKVRSLTSQTDYTGRSGREGMWIRGEREKQGKWREKGACAHRINKKSAHMFVSSPSLPWSSTRSRFIKYLTTILRRGQKGQKTRREEEAKEMKRGRDLRHRNNIKSVSMLVSSPSSSIIDKEPIYKISYDNVTIILQ